jgi:ABC-type amino acid transport substrate-binding protein
MNNIIVTILFAIIAAYLTVQSASNPHELKTAAKESAYERVLRTNTLRCGYVNWQPYYVKDPNTGTPSGMNYEIMTEVGKILDLKIDWAEEVGWGTIGEGFKTGRYDAVCTSMWPDAGKYKNMSLSTPIFYSNIVAYVRADDDRFDGHSDRINQKDVRIAVIDGAFTYNIAKSNFPEAQIVALPQMSQESEYLMMVPGNKADIILIDVDETKKFLEANPGKMRMVRDIKPIKRFPHVIAMPANEMQLTQMVNQALQLLIDNGYMAAIKEKYKTEYALPSTGYIH